MNDIKRNLYVRFVGAAIGLMALVWWCVLYPELCFPRDTYEAVYETQDNDDSDIDEKISDMYPEILNADDEQIVIGSRMLEWFSKKKEH